MSSLSYLAPLANYTAPTHGTDLARDMALCGFHIGTGLPHVGERFSSSLLPRPPGLA